MPPLFLTDALGFVNNQQGASSALILLLQETFHLDQHFGLATTLGGAD